MHLFENKIPHLSYDNYPEVIILSHSMFKKIKQGYSKVGEKIIKYLAPFEIFLKH